MALCLPAARRRAAELRSCQQLRSSLNSTQHAQQSRPLVAGAPTHRSRMRASLAGSLHHWLAAPLGSGVTVTLHVS